MAYNAANDHTIIKNKSIYIIYIYILKHCWASTVLNPAQSGTIDEFIYEVTHAKYTIAVIIQR